MSWFVFTEAELQAIRDGGHVRLADDLQERGRWTDDETLLAEARGPESTVLVGCYSKYPRRMARDPPINTLPSDTKLADLTNEQRETYDL